MIGFGTGMRSTTAPRSPGFSWFEDEPRCSTEMLAALGARPQDAVVDIGTGASRLIDALLERGFGDVTALDICPAGPRRIRERLGPTATTTQWIVHDLLRWVPSRRYGDLARPRPLSQARRGLGGRDGARARFQLNA